jgi:hypothetical protein
VTVEPQGFLRARVAGRSIGEGGGGTISNGVSQVRRGEIHRCGAHDAYGLTLGLVKRKYLLATTGRGNGRWNGGQLEVTQDAGND